MHYNRISKKLRYKYKPKFYFGGVLQWVNVSTLPWNLMRLSLNRGEKGCQKQIMQQILSLETELISFFFFFFGSFLLFVFHSGKLWNKIIPGQGIYPKDTSRWKTSPSQAFVFQQNKLPYSEISLLLPPLTSHPCSVPESSFSSMTPSVEIYQLSPGFALGLACDSRRMTRSIICVPSLFS